MSDFDLLFALLSLLLGLSIAELLQGFARVLRLKARQRAAAKGALRVDESDPGTSGAPPPVRVGWLVPLLGAYVLLDQLSFFTAAFAFRDGLTANLFTLLAITVVVGGYYLVATLVFPDEPGDWPDFDRYYDEHNRLILGFAIFAQVSQLALSVAVAPANRAADTAGFAAHPGLTALALVLAFATFPLLIAAFRAKRRGWNAALLAALVGDRLAMAALSLVLIR